MYVTTCSDVQTEQKKVRDMDEEGGNESKGRDGRGIGSIERTKEGGRGMGREKRGEKQEGETRNVYERTWKSEER